MNAIETKFFNDINDMSYQTVSASVHSEEWKMKVADYTFKRSPVDNSFLVLDIIFNTLQTEIKNQTFTVFITPQENVLSYKADFVIIIEGLLGSILKIVIEIDGHDWHEKTKEQAAYDKRRDRDITKNGYIILRFTGSEIYTNTKRCICEILEIATLLCFEKYNECGMYYLEQENEILGSN